MCICYITRHRILVAEVFFLIQQNHVNVKNCVSIYKKKYYVNVKSFECSNNCVNVRAVSVNK
jgi:hypothetical protein